MQLVMDILLNLFQYLYWNLNLFLNLFKKSSWDTYVLVYIKYFFILCESRGHGDNLS
jgi:hypothetical protein